jgi:hypothetical protein
VTGLKFLVVTLFLGLLFGCAIKERVYENIYEGLKQREQIVNPPNEPGTQKLPSYDQYKREREKALQDN